MASSEEEMDMVPESPTPNAPSGGGKGKGPGNKGTHAEILVNHVLELLKAEGLAHDGAIMKEIKTYEPNETFEDSEFLMTTVMVTMARQIQALTITVQNLDRTVNSLKESGGAPQRPPPQSRKVQPDQQRTYAGVAAEAAAEFPKPKTTPRRKRKAEAGPTPPQNEKDKARKTGPTKPTSEPPVGKSKGQYNLPGSNMAKRKIFATRMEAKPLADPVREEAKIAVAVAATLTGCVCKAPTNLQVFSNKINGTITLTAPPGTDSSEYSKYLDKLTETLNKNLEADEPRYLPFRRAPTHVDVLVHGVSLFAIPNTNEELNEEVKEAFKITHSIDVVNAKFLKPNEEDRNQKRATSIIVRVPEGDAEKIVPNVLFMGKYKQSAIMWQASPTTQCHKCWKYGHPEMGCRAPNQICPVCSKQHAYKEHKCHQTACKGHKKIIPGCCSMTPAICPACGGAHSAMDPTCEERIRVRDEAKTKYDQRMATLAEVEMAEPADI
jgi:hypothetical protein